MGIEWLRRHLAPRGIRVHAINFSDYYAMHIDCTLILMKPGLAVVNPYVQNCPQLELFRKSGWDVIVAPKGVKTKGKQVVSCSHGLTHVSWCMPGSLTSGFLWSRWRGKRSRHSQHMRNPQFYVSGKRPILTFIKVSLHCRDLLRFIG